jgi:hypothetical protein
MADQTLSQADCAAPVSRDRCDGCDRLALLVPLHDPDKGGPLRCYVCAGAWHAEHGRRRKMGRVVIRAMKAFMDGGGSWNDIDKLKVTALMDNFAFGDAVGEIVDPLGYMAETAKTADETVLLTSEVLADAIRLTHPDAHPPERQELAKRVTQQLLALQPFVFPAEKPKPIAPYEPARNGSAVSPTASAAEPLRQRYPCADCASTVPYFYCAPCRAEREKRQQEERERESAKRRKWRANSRANRKARRQWRLRACAACGKEFQGKRKDARYCSDACRQRAHRKIVTDKGAAKKNGQETVHAKIRACCAPPVAR